MFWDMTPYSVVDMYSNEPHSAIFRDAEISSEVLVTIYQTTRRYIVLS
jgi:hypothetical protein